MNAHAKLPERRKMLDAAIKTKCRQQYRDEGSTEPPPGLHEHDLAVWEDEANKIEIEERQSA